MSTTLTPPPPRAAPGGRAPTATDGARKRDSSPRTLTLAQAAEHVRERKSGRSGCGVLVIESNPDQQWRVSRMLTLEGHRVVGTSSGDGALALLAEWPVDLVMISAQLPGMTMDGIEVAQVIAERMPEVPVVLMVEDDQPHRAAALVGAAACLAKPFRLETLRELLRSLGLGARPTLVPAPAG